jgi:hypothetical protein
LTVRTQESTPFHPPYAEDDFIHGRPEGLLQADGDPRLFAVWAHGNEHLGPRVGHHIYSERRDLLTHVDYVCGNPLAAAQQPQARYTQDIVTPGFTKAGTDLNRSFTPGIKPQSYEEYRAAEIRTMIDEGDYDYVLDLHTSTTEVDHCFLISREFEDDPAVRSIIAASPIDKVIVLPEEIARWGLIGNVHNAVSIEYERSKAAAVGVQESLLTIDGLVQGRPLIQPHERAFFDVSHPIPKAEDPGLDAKNYELCADGYYPVLFGENSYRRDPSKSYLGFAATKRRVVLL